MPPSPRTMSRERLFPESFEAYLAFGAVLIIGVFYALQTGASAVWPDSLYYADRARHLLEQGNLLQSENYPAQVAPLYSLPMMIGFLFGDIDTGHTILTIVQSLLLSSAFFPLRALLAGHTELAEREVCLLTAAALLLPGLLAYAPLLLPEAMLIPLLIYAAYFLDRLFDEPDSLEKALGAGIFIGLAVLTQAGAWMLWLAALITLAPRIFSRSSLREKHALAHALVFPLLIALVWAAYLYSAAGRNAFGVHLSFNNALARFNFAKNGLLYLIYGGAPLAGLALILAAVFRGRAFWQNTFFRFSFIALALVIAYAAFTNVVIVNKTLDYFTNRALEPYLFLPLVVLMRLDPAARKDLLTNGLLAFLVLAIFGLPQGLHLDFRSGLAFWTGPFNDVAAGLVRGGLYLILICLPVLVLYVKPRWFAASYGFLALLFVAAGLSASAFFWSHNEEAHLASMEAKGLYKNAELRQSAAIYVDYRCRADENNDVAYLFSCYDLGRALYFLPHLPKKLSATELGKLSPAQIENVAFASSENDNVFGPVVVQNGLARFMRLSAGSVKKAEGMPLVHIEKIGGLHPYISLIIGGIERRVTALEPESEMRLQSSRAGCVKMGMQLYESGGIANVSFQLDKNPAQKLSLPLIDKGPRPSTPVTLHVPKGVSVLHIRYEKESSTSDARLILFDRPVIESCRGGD